MHWPTNDLTNTSNSYYLSKGCRCVTSFLLQHVLLKISGSSTNASAQTLTQLANSTPINRLTQSDPAWIHCCKRPNYNFRILPGSVATVLKSDEQNYSHLRHISSRCCTPTKKSSKSANASRHYSEKKMARFLRHYVQVLAPTNKRNRRSKRANVWRRPVCVAGARRWRWRNLWVDVRRWGNAGRAGQPPIWASGKCTDWTPHPILSASRQDASDRRFRSRRLASTSSSPAEICTTEFNATFNQSIDRSVRQIAHRKIILKMRIKNVRTKYTIYTNTSHKIIIIKTTWQCCYRSLRNDCKTTVGPFIVLFYLGGP